MSVLALERQDLDQRRIFSQATRTILRRSRFGSGWGREAGSGCWGGEAFARQEWECVLRRVRRMGLEGKVWKLGGELVLWGFEENNGVANSASNTAAIVKASHWETLPEIWVSLSKIKCHASFIHFQFPKNIYYWIISNYLTHLYFLINIQLLLLLPY